MRSIHQTKRYSVMVRSGYWASVWKEQMLQNLECRKHRECAAIWKEKADALEYWNRVVSQRDRYTPLLRLLPVSPGMRVLDIGGGPGTLAIPMAGKGAEVTVVEPASGMVSVLKDNIRGKKLSNIAILQKRWEKVNDGDLQGKYDQVIACFSLGMPEIEEAVRKMAAYSSGSVFLAWFAGVTAWERVLSDLWMTVHGSPYSPGPKAEILHQVLAEMGVDPVVTTWTEWYEERYADFEALVNDFSTRIGCTTDEQVEQIRRYLEPRTRRDRGSLIWGGPNSIQTFHWNVSATSD